MNIKQILRTAITDLVNMKSAIFQCLTKWNFHGNLPTIRRKQLHSSSGTIRQLQDFCTVLPDYIFFPMQKYGILHQIDNSVDSINKTICLETAARLITWISSPSRNVLLHTQDSDVYQLDLVFSSKSYCLSAAGCYVVRWTTFSSCMTGL